MISIKNITLLFLALALFQTCSPVDQGTFCTQVFTMINVTVEDPSGNPAEDVDITITEKESGEILPCDQYLCRHTGNGQYTIMHDDLYDDLSSSGDTFVVEGTKDGLHFQQEFTFASGVCHVEKVSGPDRVQLTESSM